MSAIEIELIKLPPHSVQAEQSVLGGLLLDRNAWDKIEGVVTEADFYRTDHRLIYRHIGQLQGKGKEADCITVAEALESARELDSIGGMSYLGALAQNTPTAANIRRHAEIVREKAVLRGLSAIADDIQDGCFTPIASAEEIATAAEAAMLRLLDRSADEPVRLHRAIGETLAEVDARRERGDAYSGLRTGFDGLDAVTSGLDPGQLVIIAARPSVGKTALACNIADYVSSSGEPVLFHTLEMQRREVTMRILAARTGVPVSAMRAGTGSDYHWRRMTDVHGKTEKTPLYIDDRAAISVAYVRAKARRLKREAGLSLIVIDYLQLMRGTGDNRTQEIGGLSRGLKALAKELQVPIIALAQLNRNVEGRNDKRPLASDLRDSGEVEQDADLVLMLHREQLYNAASEWVGLAELLVRKNRNGPLGDILLTYDGPLMLFASTNTPSPRHAATSARAPRGFTE